MRGRIGNIKKYSKGKLHDKENFPLLISQLSLFGTGVPAAERVLIALCGR